MKQQDFEAAVVQGLIDGVKNHVAKITDTIIGDSHPEDLAQSLTRFANGLRVSRAFGEAALAEIKKQFEGER